VPLESTARRIKTTLAELLLKRIALARCLHGPDGLLG
jgi:hypothetical protein